MRQREKGGETERKRGRDREKKGERQRVKGGETERKRGRDRRKILLGLRKNQSF